MSLVVRHKLGMRHVQCCEAAEIACVLSLMRVTIPQVNDEPLCWVLHLPTYRYPWLYAPYLYRQRFAHHVSARLWEVHKITSTISIHSTLQCQHEISNLGFRLTYTSRTELPTVLAH